METKIEEQTFDKRLTLAFKELSKQDIVAKENFLCCQSCGSAAIAGEVDKIEKKGKMVKGMCFFHDQDNEDKIKGRDFFLSFSDHKKRKVKRTLTQKQVGELICQVLGKFKIATMWDGDTNTRILIKFEEIN